MTKAKSKKFFEYFEIPTYDDLDRQESKLERVLNNAQEKVDQLQSREDVDALIKKTNASIDKYFKLARNWIDEQAKGVKVKDTDEGHQVKKNTYVKLDQYEIKVKEYVTLDLLVRHYIRIAKNFLAREEEEMEIIPKAEWDKDTQTFIEQYLKKIPDLKEEIGRLKNACNLLSTLGPELDQFQKNLLDFYGKDTGQAMFSSYMSGLRNMNFHKTDTVLKKVRSSKGRIKLLPGKADKKDILKKGQALQKEYSDNSDVLKLSDERIYLKESEASISLDVAKKEYKQAMDLVNKYHHPYLKNRVITLTKLHERLYAISDLHSLLRLYRMAIKGMLISLSSFEDLRMYDSCVTNQLDFLNEEKLKDLSYVESRAEDVMADLQRAVSNRLKKIA